MEQKGGACGAGRDRRRLGPDNGLLRVSCLRNSSILGAFGPGGPIELNGFGRQADASHLAARPM